MSHLTLDAVTIPVSSMSETPKEIGNRQRAFDSSYLISRRATKREWSCQSPLMQPTEAEMVRGIVQGEGQVWSLEQGTLYTTKGVPPTIGTSYVILSDIAADSSTVVDEYSDNPAYYGRYALGQSINENLFPVGIRKANDDTAFTVTGGAAKVDDTSNYWEGTNSVKCTLAGSSYSSINGAITTLSSPVSAGTVFTGSVYLKGDSGGEEVAVSVTDEDNSLSGTPTVITLTDPDTWYRVKASYEIAAGDTSDDVSLSVYNGASAGEIFYSDGWQMEQSEIASQWYDGTPGAFNVEYDYSILSPKSDMTFAAWVKMPDQGLAIALPRYLMGMNISGTYYYSLYRLVDPNTGLRWQTSDDSGNDHFLSMPGGESIWASGWHHVVCIMSHNPDTGRYNKELYFDGVLSDYENTTYIPSFTYSASGEVHLLSLDSNYRHMYGTMDQVRILPYALTATAVAELYASSLGVGATPIVIADGDGIATTNASVIGQVTDVGQTLTGQGLRKSVSFDLREV